MEQKFSVIFFCGKDKAYKTIKEYPYGTSMQQIEDDFKEYLSEIYRESNWELACEYKPGMIKEVDSANKTRESTPMNKAAKECVMIYADGACSGNPGPGGWAAILRFEGKEKELSGSEPETTNNRMELTAVIEGLSALKKPCSVTVVTDSKYVTNAIRQGWLENWKKNGWKKADKKPVVNRDLWEKLDKLLKKHKVEFEWIKGHEGHPENERCDAMAVAQYQKYLKI